jgi:Ca2+-transporting ATPase
MGKGVGSMVVIATGVHSLNGRSLLALEVEPQDTPLQQKLGVIADMIAKFAIYGAISIFIFLVTLYLILNFAVKHEKPTSAIPDDLVALLVLALTVVVVAVPEGLPLAVTLALAHATVQMLKDNNLVRNLAACETMGNATTICSDKTGTLTLNRMTIVKGLFLQTEFSSGDIPATLLKNVTSYSEGFNKIITLICKSLNINSTAGETKNKDGKVFMEGSKTEIAILNFTKTLGFPYKSDREVTVVSRMEPFSSETKSMSCIVKLTADIEVDSFFGLPESKEPTQCLFVKGAAEIVLKRCNRMVDKNGKIVAITENDRTRFQNCIDQYANDALRTISAAIKSLLPDDIIEDAEGNILQTNLILLAIFGIEDPLRPEVTNAVSSCQMAGVVVRMVTGDSAPTARAIARGCGILSVDGLVMEGPDFRKLSESQMNDILPKLQVLARSSPLDKQILVNNLKRLGETVAVTGGIFSILSIRWHE